MPALPLVKFPFPAAKEDVNNPLEMMKEVAAQAAALPIRGLPTGPNTSTDTNTGALPHVTEAMERRSNADHRRIHEKLQKLCGQRQAVKNRHLIWLHSTTKAIENDVWIATQTEEHGYKKLEEAISKIEPVTWQHMCSGVTDHPRSHWDEEAYLAFELARNAGIDIEDSIKIKTHANQAIKRFSLTELDIEATNAIGLPIRLQRKLEVRLGTVNVDSQSANGARSIMELRHFLMIMRADASNRKLAQGQESSMEVTRGEDEQTEFDRAVNERNDFLSQFIDTDIEHIPDSEGSIYGTHDWHFEKPIIQVRGDDGVTLRLAEKRVDAEVDGAAIITHTLRLTENLPKSKHSHLFDLPVAGTERERRIRKARWTISSALERCKASGSN